ncbi:TrmH family RNA methyltransferase [Patescibacteria group bacterium]|nr:TrmH family RNA methyltransferase [Patescibacteria group bacterium]MCL5091959.1 TrmH family RNA methyltransferase [Patescibacteria group bacterium]
MKLNAKQLRTAQADEIKKQLGRQRTNPLYLILENIYDTYNVGGLFRLADALAIRKIYLCGQTEIPPNAKIKKASVGTYKVVPWEYYNTAKAAVDQIRHQSQVGVIAVEQSPQAVGYTKADYTTPLALIVGNETFGVLPETLALADQIVEIPMWGINRSLNVIVSAAIVSYWAIHHSQNV